MRTGAEVLAAGLSRIMTPLPIVADEPVPLDNSIEWLTCAFASTLGVVMVGLAGAAQDHVLAYVPGVVWLLPRKAAEG
jgi:hypothetical protein